MDPDFVQQREVQIRQRRRFRVADVLAAAHAARRPAGNEDRQVGVVMYVRVPHPASVEV